MALQLVKMMETYRGRDRVMRLGTYICMLVGGSGHSPINTKFSIVSGELNACRTTLRLFDDLAMLAVNMRYGLGKKEKNPVLRGLDIFTNLLYQSYYVVEHIAWFSDKKLLKRSSAPYWAAGVAMWAVSLVAEMIKAALRLVQNRKNQVDLRKRLCLDQEEYGSVSEQNEEIRKELRKLRAEEMDKFLLIIQSCADLLNAVNWTPGGYLWSGRFSSAQSGIFGIVSSIMLLYRNWPSE
ncbi:hypothetical protein SNE40_007249 [Patella caerulea]|uniref:Peroxisomal membrane protein 11C n=1 Tax=Patella caerulea TaxID=87958 RepID=A0AAN8PX83_PATCE